VYINAVQHYQLKLNVPHSSPAIIKNRKKADLGAHDYGRNLLYLVPS
jgi:hypothetical protein